MEQKHWSDDEESGYGETIRKLKEKRRLARQIEKETNEDILQKHMERIEYLEERMQKLRKREEEVQMEQSKVKNELTTLKEEVKEILNESDGKKSKTPKQSTPRQTSKTKAETTPKRKWQDDDEWTNKNKARQRIHEMTAKQREKQREIWREQKRRSKQRRLSEQHRQRARQSTTSSTEDEEHRKEVVALSSEEENIATKRAKARRDSNKQQQHSQKPITREATQPTIDTSPEDSSHSAVTPPRPHKQTTSSTRPSIKIPITRDKSIEDMLQKSSNKQAKPLTTEYSESSCLVGGSVHAAGGPAASYPGRDDSQGGNLNNQTKPIICCRKLPDRELSKQNQKEAAMHQQNLQEMEADEHNFLKNKSPNPNHPEQTSQEPDSRGNNILSPNLRNAEAAEAGKQEAAEAGKQEGRNSKPPGKENRGIEDQPMETGESREPRKNTEKTCK